MGTVAWYTSINSSGKWSDHALIMISAAPDDFSRYNADLLNSQYDCLDRIVVRAYFGPGATGGGMRFWWQRLHDGSEADLDDNHLRRMAGRFARRLRAWAEVNAVPVIDCARE